MVKPKLYAGKTSWWGFSIDYDHWARSATISFVHWYIAIEFWSKNG